MVDANLIKMRLDKLEDNIKVLNNLARLSYEEFLGDPVKNLAAQHALQISVEACLDVGQHIIAGLGLGRPESYREVFNSLGKNKVLEPDFAQRIIPMAKFRNRLVHLYWEVDHKEIYRIMQENLGDFSEFAKQVLIFLKKYDNLE